MKYAISCDWYEVFCACGACSSLRSSDVITRSGDFETHLREYGTRVYKYVRGVSYRGTPFCVICYDPLSKQSQGGIMRDDMCHLKIENYWLYTDVWYDILLSALRQFDINPIKLSRLDIACDWQNGQCGIAAQDIMAGLMSRKYVKVHQPNWRVNGTDAAKLSWHSMAFGSKGSAVFTRFYNKTLELQATGKDYIRETWKDAGLNLERDVYRVEFALTDLGTQVIDPETGEQLDIPYDKCADRLHIAGLFFHYAQHYFDIRRAGTASKRTQCRRLDVFPEQAVGFIAAQRPRYMLTTKTDKVVVRSMIRALFAVQDIEQRRFMFNSIKTYVAVRKSNAMCRGAYRLLLDALHSDNIDPDRVADECFEITKEHFERYDSKGQWVYDAVNDTHDYVE